MRKTTGSIIAILGVPLLLLHTAQQAAPTSPDDSYLCYGAGLARGQPNFTPVQKSLEDQFGSALVDIKGILILCNPTQPAKHLTVHAVGYVLSHTKVPRQSKFAKQDHTAIDQFGTHRLTVVRPMEMRAPSAKTLGSGGAGLVDTTGVDHFQCYKVRPASGVAKFVPPPPMVIADQFGTQTYTLTKPVKLCTPANPNGEDPTAPQHLAHLLCYQAKPPKRKRFTARTVSVNNTNFGPAVLVAGAVREYCVPAFKDVLPSSSTTTVSTSTTVSTTTIVSITTTTVSSTTSTTGPIPFCTTTGGSCIGFTPSTSPCICEGYVDSGGNACVKDTTVGAPCSSGAQCPTDDHYVCAEAADGPKRCRLVCD